MSAPLQPNASAEEVCSIKGCTNPVFAVDGEVSFRHCQQHSVSEPCLQVGCSALAQPGNDFCLEHVPTAKPSSESVDEEVVITVERRRDASPKRTPRRKRGILKCPPAPRKVIPPPPIVPCMPYMPGEEMLFAEQRKTKRCACGGYLKFEDGDFLGNHRTVIYCVLKCGFGISRVLPQYCLKPIQLQWGLPEPLGDLNETFPPLQK